MEPLHNEGERPKQREGVILKAQSLLTIVIFCQKTQFTKQNDCLAFSYMAGNDDEVKKTLQYIPFSHVTEIT